MHSSYSKRFSRLITQLPKIFLKHNRIAVLSTNSTNFSVEGVEFTVTAVHQKKVRFTYSQIK